MEIWFEMTYVTQAGACQNQTLLARIAGAPTVPQVIYDSVRVPAGQTNFQCLWFLTGIFLVDAAGNRRRFSTRNLNLTLVLGQQ